jgi:hypothetical protein
VLHGDTLANVAIMPKTTFTGLFCAFLVAASFYLLAFGVTVLFGAPTRPEQGFWTPEKLFYGVLPVSAAPFILSVAFRRWAGLYARRRNAWMGWFVLFTFAVSVDATCFLKLRNRQDERIHLDWQSTSGIFSWGTGEVRVPAGFGYTREHGIDTFVGRFTSADGSVVIEHDIGELAAEHGGMGKSETLNGGSRVRVDSVTYSDDKGGTRYFSKASFPDSSCANFYLESAREKDTAVIQLIAQSYRPKGWVPSSLRPLLPEIFRSDCRYRIKLPLRF